MGYTVARTHEDDFEVSALQVSVRQRDKRR